MNGTVNLDYKVGIGSTWTIKVPLTLSASEALIVQVGKQRLALPLSYVQRCVRILPGNRLQRQGIPCYQDERGVIPCLDLGVIFEMAPPSQSPLGVLVDSGLVQAVFLVDALVARREIVTKDIGSLIGSLSYLSGAALDSDGSLTSILQVPNILQRLAAEITRTTTSQPLQSADETFNSTLSGPALAVEESVQEPAPPVTGSFLLGRTPKILLCDDSASVRKVQEKQLRQMGYEVATANDGQEALERLETEDFDLVMTDLEMPRIDGFGLVKGIRAIERLYDLPVIVITSRALEKFAGETIGLGATACLGKPFAAAQFERLIQNEPKLSGLRHQ
jgi:chemosensory pili system protein ChpA (sensor histidine kinase/response regulator)